MKESRYAPLYSFLKENDLKYSGVQKQDTSKGPRHVMYVYKDGESFLKLSYTNPRPCVFVASSIKKVKKALGYGEVDRSTQATIEPVIADRRSKYDEFYDYADSLGYRTNHVNKNKINKVYYVSLLDEKTGEKITTLTIPFCKDVNKTAIKVLQDFELEKVMEDKYCTDLEQSTPEANCCGKGKDVVSEIEAYANLANNLQITTLNYAIRTAENFINKYTEESPKAITKVTLIEFISYLKSELIKQLNE